MWNKIRFILIFCLFLQIGFAQEWLGQSRKQILSGIERKVQQAEILPDTDSLLKINCQEEDERCRKFQVSYIFTFDSDRCISYRRILPLHNYWATTFQELTSQQEAKGSGETLDVDGEMLLTDYAFEAYTLHLSIEANHLNALFKIKDQHR